MGFGALRVLNDDIIAPGRGFDTHQHDNMEIVTIVLDGAVRHRDSMGNEGTIRTGEAQRISAGSGIMHSEWNASDKVPLKLLQIWVEPKERDIGPGHEQKKIKWGANAFETIVSGPKRKGALNMHQDGQFLLGQISKGKTVPHPLGNGMGLFIFVVEGAISIGKEMLAKRDSAEITGEKKAAIKALEMSKVLLIEVPV